MSQAQDTTRAGKYKHLDIKKRAQLEWLPRQKTPKADIARTSIVVFHRCSSSPLPPACASAISHGTLFRGNSRPKGGIAMRITINDELDLQKIAESGQTFRAVPAADGYRFIHQTHILHIRPLSARQFEVDCDRSTWHRVWAPYFDLNRSYAAIRLSITGDDFLQAAAQNGIGLRVLKQDPWEMLISFLISQRKSIPAICRCIEALCDRYGQSVDTAHGPVHLFPTPEALAAADADGLRACGVGYRLPYLQDAALRVSTGLTDPDLLADLPDDALLTALMQVRGVGIKVAGCVMLFAYGRTASVPIDTWIGKIIDRQYAGKNPFPAYGDAAGILQQYAFAYAIAHKDLWK